MKGNYSSLFKTSQLFSHFHGLRNITSSNMSSIKTFIFLDLETTGLPHLEHNLTKITELCAVAVQADHIELGCFPRVLNKLSFCFNPNRMITPESTAITALSNDLLEHQGCFSSDVVDIMKKWLNMNQKPICFVAHNGNKFDYPIFRAEVEKTGNSLSDDLLCVDSLVAFREIDNSKKTVEEPRKEVPLEFDDNFDEILCKASEDFERELEQQRLTPAQVQKHNETTPKKQFISQTQISMMETQASPKRNFSSVRKFVSYKLGDVYNRLTSKNPINVHEAEGDVAMLITCAATYGEKFVTYANESAVKFSDMPIMKPGKRIGT